METKVAQGKVFLQRNQLHEEKKKVVSHLHDLQQVLGEFKPPDEREKELEVLVFGGDFEDDEDMTSECNENNTQKRKKSHDSDIIVKRVPAWEDDDDDNILVKDKASELRNCHRSIYLRGEEKYSEYTQQKFKKIVGEPTWADLDKRNSVDSDSESDEFLRKTGNFIKKSEQLPNKKIHIQKCPNLTEKNMQGSIVKSVEFNPMSKVVLMAGTNQTANLFQIDGKINAKIQSIHFEHFPVHSAHFTTDGKEVIVGSNKFAHFFSYDMMAGKICKIPLQKGMEQRNTKRFCLSPDGKFMILHGRYGNIHIITTKSKEWIGSLKMNGEVIAVTFNHDGSRLYSHGNTGEVYVWDMSSRKCIHKFIDEGCVTGTSIAVSPNDQFIACGSDSGIVNIYDSKKIQTEISPQPVKVISNLTTEITHIKFNHSSELMAIGSSLKPHAIKLVHFPSMSVFPNFPNKDDCNSIKTVNSLDISLNSGYMCIGNNLGSSSIFRLKHFKNY